ncbi:hypothetical protein [Cloacibacterium normanense]|uniref:hypothetical protein n=1 Tax=Cloacibacterium normanense TaxID=237258 RepID=UPI00391AD7A5
MNSFEKRIEDAKLNNIIQENEIISSKNIDKKKLNVFIDWFEEGSASTVGFLIRKLKLIKSIIQNGNSVTIEQQPVLILNTQEDLKNWIKNRFDERLIEDVYKE